jgi:hypothetical protein
MNSGDGLAKDRHDEGINGAGFRKLHVIRKLVWRNTLQQQLTGISVFPFIAFQRNPKLAERELRPPSQKPHLREEAMRLATLYLPCQSQAPSASFSHEG